jgi:hypothetical protein
VHSANGRVPSSDILQSAGWPKGDGDRRNFTLHPRIAAANRLRLSWNTRDHGGTPGAVLRVTFRPWSGTPDAPKFGVMNTADHCSYERIAARAYQIYEESGREPGHCTENWLRAEREMRDLPSAAPGPSEAAPPVAPTPRQGRRGR